MPYPARFGELSLTRSHTYPNDCQGFAPRALDQGAGDVLPVRVERIAPSPDRSPNDPDHEGSVR